MTLIMGWLACDQRGPCSAYMASDSRISNGKKHYDFSQKLFALKNTPDILGYCGETLFTYQVLSRLTSICDSNLLLSYGMDFCIRSTIVFDEIMKAHESYGLNDSEIKIFHIGRNSKSVFEAREYSYSNGKWKNNKINTDYEKSKILFCDGSGRGQFQNRYLDYKNGNNQDTSRNYFHCVCDAILSNNDNYTGGVPQLVGLYRGNKFNGMYHGTIIEEETYYQAMKVDNTFQLADVRWYNEKFEICDWKSRQRKDNAMIQPISKKATP